VIPGVWLLRGDLTLAGLATVPGVPTQKASAMPATDMPSTGQAPVAVVITATSPSATPAAAVANPEQIVYSSNAEGDFDLYLLDIASGESVRVADLEGDERMPAPSPDGERIAFVSNVEGDDDIFVMDVDGGNVIQVTRSTGADRSPAWSPDGSQIVFSRETVDGSSLYLVDTDCISPDAPCEDALVLVTSDRYDLFPAWSPDGTRIAFAASDFPGLPSVIALVAPQELTPVNLPGTGASDFYPAWSPDGARIAFVSILSGDYNLFTMSAWTGGELLQITGSPGSDVGPAWSVDGSQLAFASDRDGQGFDLYVAASACPLSRPGCEDGLSQLTRNPGDELDPRWLP